MSTIGFLLHPKLVLKVQDALQDLSTELYQLYLVFHFVFVHGVLGSRHSMGSGKLHTAILSVSEERNHPARKSFGEEGQCRFSEIGYLVSTRYCSYAMSSICSEREDARGH